MLGVAVVIHSLHRDQDHHPARAESTLGSFSGVTVSKERKIGIFLGLLWLRSVSVVGALLQGQGARASCPSFLGGTKSGGTTPPTA